MRFGHSQNGVDTQENNFSIKKYKISYKID